MKNLLIILSFMMASCRATKINKDGKVVDTANTRHFKKVHPVGFHTMNGYVVYPDSTTAVKE